MSDRKGDAVFAARAARLKELYGIGNPTDRLVAAGSHSHTINAKPFPMCPMEVEEEEPQEEEPPKVPVKYVVCKVCGASATKDNFVFDGSMLRPCKCRPGEEEWVVKTVEVAVGERVREVIPPAPRG